MNGDPDTAAPASRWVAAHKPTRPRAEFVPGRAEPCTKRGLQRLDHLLAAGVARPQPVTAGRGRLRPSGPVPIAVSFATEHWRGKPVAATRRTAGRATDRCSFASVPWMATGRGDLPSGSSRCRGDRRRYSRRPLSGPDAARCPGRPGGNALRWLVRTQVSAGLAGAGAGGNRAMAGRPLPLLAGVGGVAARPRPGRELPAGAPLLQ